MMAMLPNLSLNARRRLTVVVWLLGLVTAAVLLARRPTADLRALAWAGSVVLAAPQDGALSSLEVSLHQAVSRGELVARFDPGQLVARGEVLRAEFEAMDHRVASQQDGKARLLQKDEEEASLELAKLSAGIEEDEARRAALRQKLIIDERLVAEGVVSAERAAGLRREIEVVESRLSADRSRRLLAQRNLRQAGWRVETAAGPNPWLAEAARLRLSEIEVRLERLDVHSPTAGQVSEIFGAEGEWLEAGDPVVRISPLAAVEVHAWLDGEVAPDFVVGTAAEIRRANGQRLAGHVLSIGAERLSLPEALWQRTDLPEWGYLIRIALGGGVLTPGEPVHVGLLDAPVTSAQADGLAE